MIFCFGKKENNKMNTLTILKPDTKELTKMELYEYIPITRIQIAINALEETTDKMETSSKLYHWTNQKAMLLKYMKRMKDNFHRTQYTCYNNSKFGRVRPKEEMGTICMRRDLRNFLMMDYYDVDMKNCHVSIMLSVLKRAGVKETIYEHWMNYHLNREKILNDLNEKMGNVDWKKFFTSLLYYGNHDLAKNNPFLSKMVMELYDITDIIKKENPTFYEYTKRLERKKGPSHDGCFLSHYLTELEYRIMEKVVSFLYYEYASILKWKGKNVLSYELDGFKILKSRVENIDELLKIINDKIQNDYPYVEFVNKEMKEVMTIPDHLLETGQDMERYDALVNLSDENIVDILEEEEGNNIMYGDNHWFYYDGFRWNENDTIPHKLRDNIKRIVERYFQSRVSESNTVFWDKYHSKSFFLELNKTRNSVISMCKDRFFQPNAYDKFNSNEMLLGFENGVYDLEKDHFRPYRYDDYITFSTGYNWEERDEEKVSFLMKLVHKIHPDPKDLELAMTIRASGLCGKNVEKFILLNGAGRNGKGVMDTLQQEALGKDYAMTAEPTLLTSPIPKNETSVAHAQMDNKRFIIVKEPSECEKLNNATIKSITGGGQIKARMLYSNRNIVRQTWTLVCECNERPRLHMRPGIAEMERWIDIYHESNFSDSNLVDDPITHRYVPDVYFKTFDFRKKYSMTLIHILIDYFRLWKHNNYIFQLSPSVIQRSKEYMLDCNPVHSFFIQYYEPVEKTDRISVVSINSIRDTIQNSVEAQLLSKLERRLLSTPHIIRYFQDRGIPVQHPEKPTLARILHYKPMCYVGSYSNEQMMDNDNDEEED